MIRLAALLLGMLLYLALTGCAPPRKRPGTPRSYAYVLQAEKIASGREEVVEALRTCEWDWIILDVSFDGSPDTLWTAAEIDRIRSGRPGRKILAYLSIGEAETYRAYWRAAWDPDRDGTPAEDAPSFLLTENPDWGGNYRVRYWDTAWQEMILKSLDAILARGFDGVLLDIVDAFETFEQADGEYRDHRLNPETGRTYREDMVAWVGRIAAAARAARPDFRILPQNGSQLLDDPAYRRIASGIALESVFTVRNRWQPAPYTSSILARTRLLSNPGKPVFFTEYVADPVLRQYAARRAREEGGAVLFAPRELDALGVSEP